MKGKGESVWLTQALALSLKLWSEIAEHRGDRRTATRYRRAHAAIGRAVNRHCWDGSWYVRGTTDAGKSFGASRNKEGRMYLNTQSWAILADIAPRERIKTMIVLGELTS